MGKRKTPALSENEKPLSFCLVYPLNSFSFPWSVPIPLIWRDLHIACHGCRSWPVIFCWFRINSSLLEAYLAIYLPKVDRSIVWEDDQRGENRTPIWPLFLCWGSTSFWRRQCHPTPVLLPGKSHGRRSLVGCSPWGHWGSVTTERLHFHFHFYALEKEITTYSSVLAWRIPGMEEAGGLPSMGLHRVGQDWSDLAAAAAYSWVGVNH